MAFFLSDAANKEMAAADDPYFVLLSTLEYIHPAKGTAVKIVNEMFHRQGATKSRSIDNFIDLESIVNSDDERVPILTNNEIRDKISAYLNTSDDLMAAKALCMYLMNEGELYDNLNHLQITRKELLDPINEFYNKADEVIEPAFESFFDANPGAYDIFDESKGEYFDRNYFLDPQIGNIKTKFKKKVGGGAEFDRFCESLTILRGTVMKYLSPQLKDLREIFKNEKGDAPYAEPTYEKAKKRFINYLSKIL